jgi:hypothetical protein
MGMHGAVWPMSRSSTSCTVLRVEARCGLARAPPELALGGEAAVELALLEKPVFSAAASSSCRWPCVLMQADGGEFEHM